MRKLKVSHQALHRAKWAQQGVFVGATDDTPAGFLQLCRTFGILLPANTAIMAWVVDFYDNPLTKQYEIRKITELTEEEERILSAVWYAQGCHRWLK